MNDLTKGRELNVILRFTLPLLIGNMFQQLYNIADSVIVGKLLGSSSLAAISSSFNIINLILLTAFGFTLGTNIMIARFYGARDMENVKRTIDTSFIFSSLISLTITFISLLFINNLLHIFKIPENIFYESKSYLTILILGTFFTFSYNNLCSILRGIGNSKIPLYFIILSSLLNIIFDLIFIIYFKAGSNGAALATVISQIICFIGCYLYFNKNYSSLKFCIKSMQFNMNVFMESLKIGFPAAVQKLLISLGSIFIQILTNSFGVSIIAGFASASKIDSFAQLPSATLSDSLSVFTSQNIGAKKTSRIKKGFSSTFLISAVICTFITIVCIIFCNPLMKLFTNDMSVINAGSKYIKTVSYFYIFFSAMTITNGLLLGFGNSFVPLLGTILSFICFQVPVSLFLCKAIGPSGIYIAMPGGWIVGLLLRLFFVKGIYKKQLKSESSL